MVAARRANGFAGGHEWATRTRTVLRSAAGAHTTIQSDPSPIDMPVGPRRVGPYRIVETPSPQCGAVLDTTIGFDARSGCGSPERKPTRFRL